MPQGVCSRAPREVVMPSPTVIIAQSDPRTAQGSSQRPPRPFFPGAVAQSAVELRTLLLRQEAQVAVLDLEIVKLEEVQNAHGDVRRPCDHLHPSLARRAYVDGRAERRSGRVLPPAGPPLHPARHPRGAARGWGLPPEGLAKLPIAHPRLVRGILLAGASAELQHFGERRSAISR